MTEPRMNRSIPPPAICIPAAISGEFGSLACREYREPAAQDKVATTSTPAPAGSTPPDILLGATSKPAAANPITSPVATLQLGLAPPGLSQSITDIHSGSVAISRAVSPDGTRCSAQTTPPFPPRNIIAPSIVAVFQSPRRGRSAPSILDIQYR